MCTAISTAKLQGCQMESMKSFIFSNFKLDGIKKYVLLKVKFYSKVRIFQMHYKYILLSDFERLE